MRDPPGDPIARTNWPSRSNTRVGAIDERGRLPGSTRLATGAPATAGRNEKSVSWLLSMKPRTMRREPKALSMLVVIDTTLPSPSTTLRWVVEACSDPGSSAPRAPPSALTPSARIPIKIAARLNESSTIPGKSNFGRVVLSSTSDPNERSLRTRSQESSKSGRLTRKIAFQPEYWVSRPPTSGPVAADAPSNAPK